MIRNESDDWSANGAMRVRFSFGSSNGLEPSTAATDALVLKHQAISNHSAEQVGGMLLPESMITHFIG